MDLTLNISFRENQSLHSSIQSLYTSIAKMCGILSSAIHPDVMLDFLLVELDFFE